MKKVETIEKQTYVSDVKATAVKIEYGVTMTGGVISSIFGTIKKEDKAVGYINYEAQPDRMHVSFEPFSGTDSKEKKAIATTVTADINELFTEE